MITIYFQNRRLVLTTEKQRTALDSSWSIIKNPDQNAIESVCQEILTNDINVVFVTEDEQQTLYYIKQHFTVIQAGGGFVYTPEKQVLLIFRRGVWDLPKGKLDDGETIEACATREVEEETGVIIKKLGAPILTTYHHYTERDQSILKESHWFLMQAQQQGAVPQTEEDIEKVEWVNVSNLASYLENTHPSIKDVITAAQAMVL